MQTVTNPPKCNAPKPLTEAQFIALSLELKVYHVYLEEIENKMIELKNQYGTPQDKQPLNIAQIASALMHNRFTNFVNAQKQELFPNT